jgi:hypothetical protein
MYRTVNDTLWTEPWFERLSVPARLLFVCLITHPRQTACGVMEISLSRLGVDSGVGEAAEGVIAELVGAGKVVHWPEHDCVWAIRFFPWQRRQSSENFTIAARKALQRLPEPIQAAVVGEYPALGEGWYTHPHPIPIPSPSLGDKEDEEGEEEETAPGEEEPRAGARVGVRADEAVAGAETPYGLFEVLCEVMEADPAALAPSLKRKQLGIGKRLLEQGYGEAKVRACLLFLRSQAWRTSTIDLATVETEIGKWELNGMPATASARASPATNGRHDGREPIEAGAVAWMKRRGIVEQAPS